MQANNTFSIENAREFFRSKDKDGNGILDINEIRDLYKDLCKHYEQKFDDKLVLRFLNKLDKNKTNKVTENSFVELIVKPLTHYSIRNDCIALCFLMLDKNQCGYLNRTQLNIALTDAGKKTGISYTDVQLEQMFKSIDTNGDGRISLEEFLSLFDSF
jgi:Ca2+-binding EF-hand superfamily protein